MKRKVLACFVGIAAFTMVVYCVYRSASADGEVSTHCGVSTYFCLGSCNSSDYRVFSSGIVYQVDACGHYASSIIFGGSDYEEDFTEYTDGYCVATCPGSTTTLCGSGTGGSFGSSQVGGGTIVAAGTDGGYYCTVAE